ncbi:MAG: hypothetical protein WD751_00420 [Anaerolineales bacterium]
MAQRPRIDIEIVLYIAVLLLAFGLRFVNLGGAPLAESETSAALPAYAVAGGQDADLGPQPGYVLLTSLLFGVFGGSEFLARLLPAVFGLALVALPFAWRDLLGTRVALLLALFLAIDPGLVATSRMASGHMLAIAAILFALTAWWRSRPVLAGVFAALAGLAAPTIYFGLAAALLTALALQLRPRLRPEVLRPAGMAFAVTLLFGGTLLFTALPGLGGVPQVLAAFVGGQAAFPGAGVGSIALALVGYYLPALIFGGLGALRAWTAGGATGRVLSVFTALSLLVILLNPNRQVADLIWVSLPLWTLAATEIARYLKHPEGELPIAIAEAALILVLAVYLSFSLLNYASEYQLAGVAGLGLTSIVALSVVGFAGLATLLIGLGWSQRSAMQGLAWAGALIGVAFLVSASTRFARIDADSANDLWLPGPAAGSMNILTATLNDLEFVEQINLHPLPLELRAGSTALQWALREVPTPAPGDGAPALAITIWTGEVPTEFAGYRGQSFAISIQRAWDPFPPDFLSWFFLRKGPTQVQMMSLWVRPDLFPGGEVRSPTGLEPAP